MTGKIGPFRRRSRYVENGSTRIGNRCIIRLHQVHRAFCLHTNCPRLTIGSARTEPSCLASDTAWAVASGMAAAANVVEVAALVGDTARARMLAALMGGQSLTGGELAFIAGVSRSIASERLAKLVAARLVAVTKKATVPLLPLATGGEHAGKHAGGRSNRGTTPLPATARHAVRRRGTLALATTTFLGASAWQSPTHLPRTVT